MWNGIWKLTVMVGVVGVGLFAVFQAQKGMNHVSSVSSPETGSETEVDTDPSSDASPSLESTDDELLSLPYQRVAIEQPRRGLSESRIDLASNPKPDSSRIKTAIGSGTSSPHKVSLTSHEPRKKGLSFQEDNDFAEEESSEESENEAPSRQPDPLPEASFEEVPNPLEVPGSTGPAEEAAAEEENADATAAPEPKEDPFDQEVAAENDGTTTKEAAKDAAKDAGVLAKPSDEFDFGDVSEIPRSRRGIEKSEKKIEPADEGGDEFDEPPKAMEAPPAIDPEAGSTEEAPAETPLENPESSEEPESEFDAAPVPEEKAPAPEESSLDTPKTLPLVEPAFPDEEADTPKSVPARNRPALPADLDTESLEVPSPRSREVDRRPAEPEPVSPAELLGDGVAGDESQRGVQQPRLTIEKVAQQQALLDQELIYTIIVRNQGTVAAHNVVVEDRIPKGTELVGSSPRAELVGKTLIWKQPVLKPNEEKKISIKVIPRQEGPIGSVARVHFATEVTAEIQVAAPQLEFTVAPPATIRVGQELDLVFHLKNVGKVEASNISVRDIVPDHLRHETGNDIECPIGKLAPNEVREIVLPVVAHRTGTGLNRAILTADGGIRKQLETTIEVLGEELVVTRTGHNRVYVERPAVFTNTIRNEGNSKVSKVHISEVVPAGMEFQAASDGGKYDPNLNAVVWNVGPLAPGDDRAITVKYVPKETGTLSGKITATGASGSTAVVNSSVEVVGRPELQMESLSATGVVNVGDKITSKFQLKNTGTGTARNVQLSIQLPPELRLVTVHGTKFQKTKDNRVFFEKINELSPKSNATFELILEPTEETDTRIVVEISADHLSKPHHREESIQIVRESLK